MDSMICRVGLRYRLALRGASPWRPGLRMPSAVHGLLRVATGASLTHVQGPGADGGRVGAGELTHHGALADLGADSRRGQTHV